MLRVWLGVVYVINLRPPCLFPSMIIGAHSGLSDGVGRRRCLLPGLQRYRLRGQRGERPSLYPSPGSNYVTKHPWYKESARDSQRPREYLRLHAGNLEIHVLLDHIHKEYNQTVLDDATTAWGIKVERVEM